MRKLEPPERFFERLAHEVGVAVGNVRAGEPADVGVGPEVGRNQKHRLGLRSFGHGLRCQRFGGCFGSSDAFVNAWNRLFPSPGFNRGGRLAGSLIFHQQESLDARGPLPAQFAVEAERVKGLRQRLAQPQPVKEIERRLSCCIACSCTGVARGLGQNLQNRPRYNRPPERRRRKLRVLSGKDTARAGRPLGREERFERRHARGVAQHSAEGWRQGLGFHGVIIRPPAEEAHV